MGDPEVTLQAMETKLLAIEEALSKLINQQPAPKQEEEAVKAFINPDGTVDYKKLIISTLTGNTNKSEIELGYDAGKETTAALAMAEFFARVPKVRGNRAWRELNDFRQRIGVLNAGEQAIQRFLTGF